MSDPKVIYLQPECCADPYVGRLWCEHADPEDCEDGRRWAKYVLDGWQDISKAPRDGTVVDLWHRHGHRVANMRWCNIENVWYEAKPCDADYWLPSAFTHFKHITGPDVDD